MKLSRSKKDFLWRSAQIISRQGVIFAIFLSCSRFLTPYELGIYSYTMAVVALLSLICDFGLSVSVSKLSAESIHRHDNKHKLIIANAMTIVILTSLIAISVIYLCGNALFDQGFRYVLLASPLAFLIPAVSIVDGYLRGIGKFRVLSYINIFTGALFTIAAVFITKYFGINGAIATQLCLYFVLLTLLLAYSGKHNYQLDHKLIRELGQTSVVIGLIGVSYFLYTKMDLIILKEFGQIAEIGMYEMLNKILMIIGLPFMVFATVAGPKISKLYVSKNWASVNTLCRRYVARSLTVAAIVALTCLVPIIVFTNYIFPHFEIKQVILVVSILLFTYIFHMVADVVGNAFIVYTGYAKLNLVLISVFGLINVALDLLLVPLYGFNGVIYTKLVAVIGFALSLSLTYLIGISRLSKPTEAAHGLSESPLSDHRYTL